jgi:hypothetical protein
MRTAAYLPTRILKMSGRCSFLLEGLLRKLDPESGIPGEGMDCRELGPIVDELHQKWVSMVIDNKRLDKRKDLASFQIANGWERRRVMRVEARSGIEPRTFG